MCGSRQRIFTAFQISLACKFVKFCENSFAKFILPCGGYAGRI
ncbi:hypothetical protein CAMRE0001_2586 [Campylobacter rectus RM3267]|uniref:Uncharacterized protein n=1 Tax=Campylobacter rectus RM3267 TaxID=553218 RepID=B9D414_CAMRE|nr:hypothetical protein CAMRE0001_2586 [Campylobacter rectus RM3267]